jgi:hypothetical protein
MGWAVEPSGLVGAGGGEHSAALVLSKMLALGLIDSRKIQAARTALDLEVRDIEERLSRLREGLSDDAAKTTHRRASGSALWQISRTTERRISPKRLQTMRLQARYLRALSGIPKNQRAKYRSMIGKVGKGKTVEAMERFAAAKRR